MSGIINVYNEDTQEYVEIPSIRGPQGLQGNSITNIIKIGSVSNVDYYRITLTNGEYTDFTVTNGTGAGDMTQVAYDSNYDGIVNGSDALLNVNTSFLNKVWTGTKAQYDAIASKDSNTFYYVIDEDISYEDSTNKVTSISSSSTDIQYPSAKLLYDQLNLKVDKIDGKGLSTNDYDATEKANVASNTSARHTHSNKALLDTYTQTEANIADAVTKKHEHSNKTVLDNTTASYTTAEQTKLNGIETGAQVNVITSVAGRTGSVVISGGDINAGTLNGKIQANSTSAAIIGDPQVRDIYIGTDDIGTGADLATGSIYLVYKE